MPPRTAPATGTNPIDSAPPALIVIPAEEADAIRIALKDAIVEADAIGRELAEATRALLYQGARDLIEIGADLDERPTG